MPTSMTDEGMVHLEKMLNHGMQDDLKGEVLALIARVREEQAKAAAAREEQREVDALACATPPQPKWKPGDIGEAGINFRVRTKDYAAAIRATPLTATPLEDKVRELEAKCEAASRFRFNVHDALHAECDGTADVVVEIQALKSERDALKHAFDAFQTSDNQGDDVSVKVHRMADRALRCEKAEAERDAARAGADRLAGALESVEGLKLECVRDDYAAPAPGCDCATCATVREFRAALAAHREGKP